MNVSLFLCTALERLRSTFRYFVDEPKVQYTVGVSGLTFKLFIKHFKGPPKSSTQIRATSTANYIALTLISRLITPIDSNIA